MSNVIAIITAVPALLVAVAAFWQTVTATMKGNADHATNVESITANTARIAALEVNKSPLVK